MWGHTLSLRASSGRSGDTKAHPRACQARAAAGANDAMIVGDLVGALANMVLTPEKTLENCLSPAVALSLASSPLNFSSATLRSKRYSN